MQDFIRQQGKFTTVPAFKYTLARLLWSSWKLNRLCNRLCFREEIRVRDFDVVFDGFPRSSNTFGALMLSVTQQDRLKVLMHKHRPSVFYRASRIGKPACLTLRNPIHAVASWVIYSNLPVQKVIDDYIFFYEVLLPVRSKFLVLPFAVITHDFQLVCKLINFRFGLNLAIDFEVESCSRETFRRIDAQCTDRNGRLDPLKVPRPEEARDELNARIRQEVLSPRYASSLKRCQELYEIYKTDYSRDLALLCSSPGSSKAGLDREQFPPLLERLGLRPAPND